MVIYHLPWAFMQILLRDAASTIPVGSAAASMLPKLAAASTLADFLSSIKRF